MENRSGGTLPGNTISGAEVDPGFEHEQVRLGTTLSVITVAQILSAFGIQWYTIAHLGVGMDADALYAGATLPQAVTVLLMEPLGFVLIPFLSSKGESERNRLAWPLVSGIGVLSVVATVVLIFLAPPTVRILAPGLTEFGMNLTVQLAQIQLLGVIGGACGTVLVALSQARGQFVWPALSLVLATLGGWGALVAGLDHWGVRFAAWTQVGITTFSAVILLPTLGRPTMAALREMPAVLYNVGVKMRPLVISVSYSRSGFVVDRFLASLLSPGSITILDFVLRIHSAMSRVLNHGVAAPVIPTMARFANEGAWSAFNALWRRRAWWMGCLSCGASLLLVLTAVGLYQTSVLEYWGIYGKVNPNDFVNIWGVLVGCSGVLCAAGVSHIFVNAFYAQGDMALPAKIEIGTYTTGLIFKAFGLWWGGLVGIAAAISAYYLLTSVVLGVVLNRRVGRQLLVATSVGVTGSVFEVRR